MWRARLVVGCLGLLLLGCETPPAAAPVVQRPPKVDSQRIQEDVAMYLGRPLHKALFINTSGTHYYANWSGHPEDDAVYMSKPLHKVLYVNVVQPGGDGQKTISTSSWGLPDVQAAIDEGDRSCRNYAASVQTDPNRCVPVYIDEQKVLDWSIYQ